MGGVLPAMQLTVVSLFDESGNALRPWAARGFACYAYDILNDGRIEHFASGGFIEYRPADLTDARFVAEVVALRPAHVMGFPPCTDLAVCGTRAWAAKAAVNPHFQHEAVALCRVVETVGEACGCAWMLENPVSRLSTMWRRFDHLFNPYEYGGYLPEDDVHPRWPKYILPRDAYPKKTCLWVGGGLAYADEASC